MLPVLLGLLVLPVNKRLKYEGLINDCFNHGIWIYDRIHYNEKPVDIAFLGSSHTINGVNDRLIEQGLEDQDLNVANFGYCRLGRNLSYVMLKEILSEKSPKYVVLEVREDESKYSHPIFPFVAKTTDVILANPFFNKDLFADIWTHLAYKVDLTQQIIYERQSEIPNKVHDFGFATSKDTATMALLDDASARRSHSPKEVTPLERKIQLSYPRNFLRKMAHQCQNNGIEIIYLYLPVYGSKQKLPKEYKTYSTYGRVLIPPQSIIEDPSNWFDDSHFNQTGANKLASWLTIEVREILRSNN